METNPNQTLSTGTTSSENIQPQTSNSFLGLISYFVWFFLFGTGIWTLIRIWNEPFLQLYNVEGLFFNSLIIFIVPSLITSIFLSLEKRKATTISIIIFLITIGILVLSLFGSGEGGLGVLIYSGFIFMAFVASSIIGRIIHILVNRIGIKKVAVIGIIILIITFLIIAIRVATFSNSTDPLSCTRLNIYGRSDCFKALAEKKQEAQWCFAIETDSLAPRECMEKVGTEKLSIASCNELQQVGISQTQCINKYFTLHGTLMDCENGANAYMSSNQCINLILDANKNSGKISDCSVLKNGDNKMMCYSSWQHLLSNVNSYEACKTITNQSEKDICYNAYFYKTSGLSGSSFENICMNIQGQALRNQCLDKVKGLRGVRTN